MINKQDFSDQVAGELRALRAKYNKTQKEVAQEVAVDVMTIVRYENNSTSMKLDILERILSAYNTDITIFFENISANKQNN